MFKLTFIFLFFAISLFGVNLTITCIGKKTGKEFLLNSLNTAQDSSLDEVWTPFQFYDSSSVACGGNIPSLIMYTSSFDSGEFVQSKGISSRDDERLITKMNDGGILTNNVILVNDIPCLPANITSFYSYLWLYNVKNLADVPYVFTMSAPYFKFSEIAIDSQTATSAKNACGSNSNSIDYTPYLNKIIDNTSMLSNITGFFQKISDFFTKETDKDTSLEGLAKNHKFDSNNSSDYTSLNSSISNYADSGFKSNSKILISSNCSAPAPIIFSVRGRSYEVFNISKLGSGNIQLIRDIFLFAGYIAGFIVVFRTV